jgi:hypothetical protein
MQKLNINPKFISTFNQKCLDENADFDKEYHKIIKFKVMEKDEYLFALQNVNTFKEQFLVPHYRLRNLLEIFNNEVELIRKEKLNGMLLMQKMKELKKMRRQMANSKIEIYFCNVSNNEKLKPLANAVMPYGLIHTGIMIDDMAIQWGRSVLGKSLVIPSNDVLYDDYIFAIEIENKEIWNLIKETFYNLPDYLTGVLDSEKMGTKKAFEIADRQLTIIAEQSVKYNTDKSYNLVFKNCQHFANKLLDKLNLTVDTSGEVGKVLKMTMDKLNKFDFSFKGKVFKKREDLDKYLSINDFSQFSKDERRILFCYRNVFDYWARVFPNDDKYKSQEIALKLWDDLAEREKFGEKA